MTFLVTEAEQPIAVAATTGLATANALRRLDAMGAGRDVEVEEVDAGRLSSGAEVAALWDRPSEPDPSGGEKRLATYFGTVRMGKRGRNPGYKAKGTRKW